MLGVSDMITKIILLILLINKLILLKKNKGKQLLNLNFEVVFL